MKKVFTTLLLVGFLFFVQSTMVFASNPDGYICNHGYHTFGDHVMTGGVGNYGVNRRYFWMTGFDSNFNGYVRNAVSEWVNTSPGYPNITTSISIRETTNRSSAMFEFWNSVLPTGVLGQTKFYVYNTEITLTPAGELPQNYGWTKMLISSQNLYYYGISASQCKATISHELGHGMGLSHQNNNIYSIMCQASYNRIASRGSAIDCITINHLYN
ncbi:MAG: Matrixin [Fusobacteria bacterium]|nr:MAG: Matrixin [Fusobacteriota bacterium]KAF0228874.1 MAG: hypothetical protein FD182_1130 [Fusobacteriota bacterium]